MEEESYQYWINNFLSELLSSHYLSKNITSIIIDYLTDPPVLPYLEELQYRTRCVCKDPDWYYNNYSVNNRNRGKHIMKKSYIFIAPINWLVVVRN